MSTESLTLWIRVPADWFEPGLAPLLQKEGIGLMVDLHAPKPGEIKRLAPPAETTFVLRLFCVTRGIIPEILAARSSFSRLFVEASMIKEKSCAALFQAGLPLGFIVRTREELELAGEFPNAPLIGRGNELEGFGGPLGTMVLLQLLRRHAQRPFLIDGPFDLEGAAAARACGAAGVIIGAAAWGFPEMGERLSARAVQFRGTESIRLENPDGTGFRFGFRPRQDFAEIRKRIAKTAMADWPERIGPDLFPAGQDIDLSKTIRAQFPDLTAFLRHAKPLIEKGGSPGSLPAIGSVPGPEFSSSLPVIQGPMANISDNIDFVQAVYKAGGIPTIAFARRPAESCRELLTEARKRGIPAGVGIIGLPEMGPLLRRQMELLRELPPPFVILAAPDPDVAKTLLDWNLNVIAHAPAVPFLVTLHEAGCRSFILEGSESGGHIGRLSSIPLWQQSLREIRIRNWTKGLHLFFAGGLVTRTGPEFIAALIRSHGFESPLSWGIQAGSAYLVTREAVGTGAISLNYRNRLVNQDITLVTGETVGLRVRQVSSPFVSRLLEKEEEMVVQGMPTARRRELFEHDNIGNLARAVESKEGEDGSFMAGEVTALTKEVRSIRELHREFFPVSSSPEAIELPRRTGAGSFHEPVAIIGIGCVFPGATEPVQFFENVLSRRCFIKPMPDAKLSPDIFFSEDRSLPYVTYSRIGGYLDRFAFDPVVFKIPPKVAERMDLGQKLALECARQALSQAGFLERPFDRSRTAVMVGNSMGGEASVDNLRAIHFQEFCSRTRKLFAEMISPEKLTESLLKLKDLVKPVPITEDSLPGELASLIAGRICSVFDLHGANFTMDAACGSGLAAIIAGVNALRLGQFDMVLAGGVDTQMDPGSFVKFAKVTALSATGSYPFDARADGFVMGEGAGMVLLKRLSDAKRDGDKIWAVILGTGQSSDGKGKGITAPNADGQLKALQRAWDNAGISPHEAGYFEAHGTGTRVGDEIELLGLSKLLGKRPNDLPKVAVGSVKAMFGHLKAAAGIAGLLKAVWAVHQRLIPPQVNFEKFPEGSPAGGYPLYVPIVPEPYGEKRFLAGVSSFGFGGTNHHIVLSEPMENRVPIKLSYDPSLRPPEIAAPAVSTPTAVKRGLTALVFPGQGSQYVNMLAHWRHEPGFREVLATAEKVFSAVNHQSLTAHLFPEGTNLTDPALREKHELLLQNTLVAQPAIFTVSAGLFEIFRKKIPGFDMVLGHSLGEYTALYAAGVLSLEDALNAVCIRGRYMTAIPGTDLGCMGMIAWPEQKVQELLGEITGYAICSNLNSPGQTVISGETPAVEEVLRRATAKGANARKLNVSAAFHSNLVAGAVPMFRQQLQTLRIKAAQVRTPANLRGEWYPIEMDNVSAETARDTVIDMLARQVTHPVDFLNQIERAYEAGVRTFVEVGPKNVLTRLIGEILEDRDHTCFFLDHPKQDVKRLFEKAVSFLQGKQEPKPEGEAAVSHKGETSLRAPAKEPKTERAGTGPADIERTVLKIIQEISGYPEHVIKPETDLEGELGVDTLKLFEVGSRIKDLFPGMKSMKLDLPRLRTLGSIASMIRDHQTPASAQTTDGQPPQAGLPGDSPKTGSPAPPRKSEIARYELKLAEQSLPTVEPIILPEKAKTKLALVKSSGVAEFDQSVQDTLARLGWEPRLWHPVDADFETLEGGGCPNLLSNISLYVHVIPTSAFTRKTRKSFYREQILSLFLCARQTGKNLAGLFIVTDQGGKLGSPPGGIGFLSGVIHGLCASLVKDFPGMIARGLDLPAFTGETGTRMIQCGLRHGIPPMAGFPDANRMLSFKLLPAALDYSLSKVIHDLRNHLHQETVILATGGGSGITLRIVELLALEFRPKLVILGRRPERTEILTRIRGHGSEVGYFQCDLADGPAVDKTAGFIRKLYPRIDILIHGAGIETSRHLSNKTPGEIDRIYRVKVAGLVNLLEAYGEENVGLVVNFSSISSLFGNPGQVDYAAANGFLNRFSGQGKARFLTIAWSAWSEVGMAAQGALHEILRSHGVEFIEPEMGERFFLRELHHTLSEKTPGQKTVAFFGKLGPNLEPPPGFIATSKAPAPAASDLPVIGIIDWDLNRLTHLNDHAIGGRCVLPAVESMNRLLESAFGKDLSGIVRFQKVKFHAPVKIQAGEKFKLNLHRREARFELWAEATRGTEKSLRRHLSCDCELLPGLPAEREKIFQQLQKYRFLLQQEVFHPPLSHSKVEKEGLYKILFHGPRFQVIQRVAKYNLKVLLAEAADGETIRRDNPLFDNHGRAFCLEAALHGAGIVCLLRVMSRKFFLPSSIERLTIDLEGLKRPGPRKVWVEELGTRTETTGATSFLYMKFQVIVADADDLPLLWLDGLEMVASQDEPTNKETFITAGNPYVVGKYPMMGVFIDDAEKASTDGATVQAVLSPPEREKFASYTLPKRRFEWLAGRIALKTLIRELVREKLGLDIGMNQFSVISDGEQPRLIPEPTLHSKVMEYFTELKTSITHGGGLAAAIVGRTLIGMDVEAIRVLEDRMIPRFLNEPERKLLPPHEYIALWTAKEAVCKAHGAGFGVGDLLRLHVPEFGYNEPYVITIPDIGKKYTCLTFKDSKWVLSIATAA